MGKTRNKSRAKGVTPFRYRWVLGFALAACLVLAAVFSMPFPSVPPAPGDGPHVAPAAIGEFDGEAGGEDENGGDSPSGIADAPATTAREDALPPDDGQAPAEEEASITIELPAGEVTLPADSFIDYRESSYQPDVVLVQPAEGAAPDQIIRALAEQGLPGVEVLAEEPGLLKLGVPGGLDVSEVSAVLRVQESVAGAQPNFTYQVMGEEGIALSSPSSASGSPSPQVHTLGSSDYKPGDTLLGRQWALESMKVYEAWNSARGAGNVAVAVIDQAFYANHPDLKANVKATYDAAEGGTDVASPGNMWHGTHVAGIVGAVADNGQGIAGVSYNADLVLIKVLDDAGLMTTESIRKAYDYVSRYNQGHSPKVRVVNMSLGTLATDETVDTLVYDKIESAFKQGIVTVCAAGNSATAAVPYKNFPADYDTVVSVINLEKSYNSAGAWKGETRNSTSNYNTLGQKTKDISAPGTGIISLKGDEGGYVSRDGTSMASPAVAGVFALVFAKNPKLGAQQAVDVVYSTAKDLGAAGFDRWYGYGEANAAAAVKGADGYLSGDNAVSAGSSITLRPANASGTWNWESSDPGIATVSGGTVRGVKAGFATITARGNGKALSRTIAVYPTVLSGANSVVRGKSITLTPSTPPTGSWKFSSSNTAVATVNGSGVVTGKARGSAVIKATHAYHGNVKMTKTVKVTTTSISPATISAIPEQTYTGKAITPKPTVKFNGKTLKLNTDYTLSYANNVKSGTATVTVTGKGAYEGAKKAAFKIAKAWKVAGATRMPVGSTAAWTCTNCTLKVISGTTAVSASKTLLTAKTAGVAKVGVYNSVGRLVATKTVTVYKLSGTYSLASAQNKNLVLDVEGCSTKNGANLELWKKNGGKNQKFRFYRQADGFYEIRCVQSGKLMDISGCSKANGGNALQWARNGGANQRWSITVDASNRLTFVNKNSRKALDLRGAKAGNGVNVQQWTNLNRTSQKWVLVS